MADGTDPKASYDYDAFISYRHVEPDRTWAKWLHRSLETYRTPRRLVRDGHLEPRLRRCFRDEEELSASPDLSASIEDALKRSRHLIVVCSPRTQGSRWVNEEVTRFRELGRGDRVLALLVEGEPQQSFPKSLREIHAVASAPAASAVDDGGGVPAPAAFEPAEPLAADVRADPRESARYLKRTAKLRLLARILGCGFDDLQRREYQRRMRALAQGAVLTLAVLATLGVFWMQRQIAAFREEQAKRERLQAVVSGLVVASQEAKGRDPTLSYLLARDALRRAMEGGLQGIEPAFSRALAASCEPTQCFRRTLASHERYPTSLALCAFSPRGDMILAAFQSEDVEVWSLEGNRLASLERHTSQVRQAIFAPDGRSVLTLSEYPPGILSGIDGKRLTRFDGYMDRVRVAAFSPDGRLVLTGSEDQTARLWDLSGKEVHSFAGKEGPIIDVRFSPGGDRMFTASSTGAARTWSADGQELGYRAGDETRARTAALSPDGARIAVAVEGNDVILRELSSGKQTVLRGHERPVLCVRFSPTGDRVVTGSQDHTARVWGVDGRELAVLKGHEGSVRRAEFSPAGNLLLTVSADETARIWRTTGVELTAIRGRQSQNPLEFSPDGRFVLDSDDTGAATLLLLEGRECPVLSGHRARVLAASYSASGERIFTASADRTLRVWSREGTLLETLDLEGGEPRLAVFSSDSTRLLTSSGSGQPSILNLEARVRTALEWGGGALREANFATTGDRLLTVTEGGSVGVWNGKGQRLVAIESPEGEGQVAIAALGPGGDCVATVSNVRVVPERSRRPPFTQSTVRVWGVDGTSRTLLRDGSTQVISASFSPSGDRLLLGFDGRDPEVWNPTTGERVPEGVDARSRLITSKLRIPAVMSEGAATHDGAVLSPGGDHLLTWFGDGLARLWPTDPGALRRSMEGRPVREFTPEERRQYADLLRDEGAGD